jgi:predicted aldo/keto reductase-like oxidoreductase
MKKRCGCGGEMQVRLNSETGNREWQCGRCEEREPIGLDIEQQLADAPRLFD